MRVAAFDHVRRLTALHGELTSEHLKLGLQFEGARVPLVNPQRGIFKPRVMDRLLSIRTVYPSPGRRVWYDDQRQVHAQVYGGSDVVDYAFMGTDPEAADNNRLREAAETGTPVLYFLGTSPKRYQAVLPTYVVRWDAGALKAMLAFGEAMAPGAAALIDARPPESAAERRYGLTLVKRRLHQASFRTAVLDAYGGAARSRACPRAGCSTRRISWPTGIVRLMAPRKLGSPLGC